MGCYINAASQTSMLGAQTRVSTNKPPIMIAYRNGKTPWTEPRLVNLTRNRETAVWRAKGVMSRYAFHIGPWRLRLTVTIQV
jgi:hypothetical protein